MTKIRETGFRSIQPNEVQKQISEGKKSESVNTIEKPHDSKGLISGYAGRAIVGGVFGSSVIADLTAEEIQDIKNELGPLGELIEGAKANGMSPARIKQIAEFHFDVMQKAGKYSYPTEID